MVDMDLGDPRTFWLTVTNIALAAVTLLCFVAVGWGAVVAVLARLRRRWGLGLEPDDHAFATPGLGLTMADGGRKVKDTTKP